MLSVPTRLLCCAVLLACSDPQGDELSDGGRDSSDTPDAPRVDTNVPDVAIDVREASTWLEQVGLLWPDRIEPEDSGVFSDVGGQVVYVDCNARAQGDGTREAPFRDLHFLGGRNLDGSNRRSSIPLGPGDHIRIRGTCRGSEHRQGSAGATYRIELRGDQLWDGDGGFNAFVRDRPLVIEGWPGERGPTFDCEDVALPDAGGDSGRGAIYTRGSGANRVDGLVLKNLEITRCHNLGVVVGERSASVTLVSLWVHDNLPQSQSPAMNGGIGFDMSEGDSVHLLDHCLVHNNDNGVTNNQGEINVMSAPDTTLLANRLDITNSEIRDGFRAITGKHSGRSSVFVRNNYVHGFRDAHYLRGGVIDIAYNVYDRIEANVLVADYQRLATDLRIRFDHNTVRSAARLFVTTFDRPSTDSGASSLTFSNNAVVAEGVVSLGFAMRATHEDGARIPSELVSAFNLFGRRDRSDAFFEGAAFVGAPYDYPAFAFAFGDDSSRLESAELDPATLRPVTGGNADGTGEDGRSIGAL